MDFLHGDIPSDPCLLALAGRAYCIIATPLRQPSLLQSPQESDLPNMDQRNVDTDVQVDAFA